jgi:trans-aconitate methyltransferase
MVGVDRSPEMIRQAKEKYPSLWFEVMDALEIALDGNFDAVFSNATLHWINEPERVIAGIKKSLRPGGRFVAEFGGKGNTGELLKAVQRAWTKLQLAGPAPQPWYYPSLAEYAGLLEQHGFEVTHATLFDRPTPLDDGERGLRNWLEMFGSDFVEGLPEARRESLLVEIERELRPKLFHDDHWVMDYRRLRVVAKRLD